MGTIFAFAVYGVSYTPFVVAKGYLKNKVAEVGSFGGTVCRLLHTVLTVAMVYCMIGEIFFPSGMILATKNSIMVAFMVGCAITAVKRHKAHRLPAAAGYVAAILLVALASALLSVGRAS